MPCPAIVILTGAGISKESGLDTFRDADGLWAKVRLEDVATPEAFARDPAGVHAFYNARRRGMAEAAVLPNAAHRALAHLERSWPGDFLLVTQNIDDLHERAGSAKLIHMHGELLKARCARCGGVHPHAGDLALATPCPGCAASGGMRPHVVWFGEMPLEMERISAALRRCRLFLSIGTSGSVYPAAGFVQQALLARAHTVELNLEPSEGATLFRERRYGPASEVVPDFVGRLLAALYSSGDEQDDDDDQQQAQPAARVVAPAAAVRPGGQGADQQHDKDDQKDGAKHGRSSKAVELPMG